MKLKLSVDLKAVLALTLSAYSGNKKSKVNQEGKKPDVILIAVDDLNDWIGVLGGHPQAKTPNMDRLAKRSVLLAMPFVNHQYATRLVPT